MTLVTSLTLMLLTAPPCESTWIAATTPDNETTIKCLRHFLGYGYSTPLDEETLSLDPSYGHPVELTLSNGELARMVEHAKRACPEAKRIPEEVCGRAIEFFEGMQTRKLSVFENVDVGTFEAPLAKVLKGERLTPKDLLVDHEDGWSMLTLHKLKHAPYARHGKKFADDLDLDLFFYAPRTGDLATPYLPLRSGTQAKVKLTEADKANIALIEKEQARRKKASLKR